MFLTFLLATAAAVIALLIAVARQPSTFQVSRQAVIAASPAMLFDRVNSFYKWGAWSPWAKLDPAAKNSFWRKILREGGGICLVWQQKSWRRTHDDHREPAERVHRDQT